MVDEPRKALNEEHAMFRGMLRELCAVNESSGAMIPRTIAAWWDTEKKLLEIEREAEERVKTAKREQIQAEIARLEAELAAL